MPGHTPFGQRVQGSQGRPGINPLSLPGLELYLRSDLGIVAADGSPVATWLDQSVHARNATPSLGTMPVYHSTGASLSPSSKPTVTFDGLLDGLDGVWPALSTAQGFTAYILARTRIPINGFNVQSFWSGFGARPRLKHSFLNVGPPQYEMLLQDTTFGNRFYGVSLFGYNDYEYVCLPPPGIGGGDNLGYQNGETIGPSIIDWDWSAPGPNYTLGYGGGSDNCNMDLFAIAIYSIGHDAATVAGVRRFLRSAGQFG